MWDEGVYSLSYWLKSNVGLALKISGQDPDYHRSDLEAAIESGAYPTWTFSIQVIPSSKENDFDFE
jgi:catalase